MKMELFLKVLLLTFLAAVYQTNAVTTTDFLQALLQDYDSRIPPSFDLQKPTDVQVQLVLDNVDSISEQTMDFSANLMITQEWTDPRLMFFGLIEAPYLELDAKMIGDVWVPDLYFANEKRASFHDITVPNRMMHLYSNGSIKYKARVSVTASCPMNLQRYPMDSQVCSILIKSFAYSMANVIMHWSGDTPITANTQDLPQFRLNGFLTHNCCVNTDNCPKAYNNESFSCLRADLLLEREIGYFMIQIYIPSVMIVALSWVSFWLSVDAVPARISLGILTVLTMTTQKSAAIASLPKVSYVKSIDVWMATCLLFVFAALLEYALANVVLRGDENRSPSTQYAPVNDVESGKEVDDSNELRSHKDMKQQSRLKQENDLTGIMRASFMDKIARGGFPLAFGSFCLIYWIIYTV